MSERADSAPASPPVSPSRVRELLRRHGLTPDKGFGQNFLIDAAVLRSIVEAADVRAGDTVLEVGPGLGVLTVELARRAERVVSVELDARLLPALAETLVATTNVEVVQGDATDFDLDLLPPRSLLVANLPYNAATAVVSRALTSCRFARLVFLVQREVAQRMCARPSTPEYGALTLLVAHFGRARIVRSVPPGVFLPPPKVTSAVVRIDVRPDATPDPELFDLIRHGFAHRRKTLLKNLILAGYPREGARLALVGLGLDPRVRAEELDLDAFLALRRALRGGDAPR